MWSAAEEDGAREEKGSVSDSIGGTIVYVSVCGAAEERVLEYKSMVLDADRRTQTHRHRDTNSPYSAAASRLLLVFWQTSAGFHLATGSELVAFLIT